MTLKELYDTGTDILEDAGVDSPECDAMYLLEHVTGLDRGAYLLNKDKEVQQAVAGRYLELIDVRKRHVPYQYITGGAYFYGYRFFVDSSVLIPRLDTEVLAEKCLELLPAGGKVLDMCTGSGCIAVTIKAQRPDADVSAADISEKALEIAQKNAGSILEKNGTGTAGKIKFIRSDLFENIDGGEEFDMIVSNPPYVTDDEYENLMPEVRDHEPKLALTAGREGLDIYKRLIPAAFDYLKDGGTLALEIGCSQADAVKEILSGCGFKDIRVTKDLAGLNRVVTALK